MDMGQVSLNKATVGLFLQQEAQAQHDANHLNPLSTVPLPSTRTIFNYKKKLLPELAAGHATSANRARALNELLNPLTVAAAIGLLNDVPPETLINMDKSILRLGRLLSEKPLVMLGEGSLRDLGSMNLSPGTVVPDQKAYFALGFNLAHSAAGNVVVAGLVAKHVNIKEMMVFNTSDEISICFMPTDGRDSDYYFDFVIGRVLPRLRATRQRLLEIRNTSQRAQLQVRQAHQKDAAEIVGQENADELDEVDQNEVQDADNVDLGCNDDSSVADNAPPVSSSSSSSSSAPNLQDNYANIDAALLCDGDIPQIQALLADASVDALKRENCALLKFPAASSARSQPHDRGDIAHHMHRLVSASKLKYEQEGFPSAGMSKFLNGEFKSLGLPKAVQDTLRHFLTHFEAMLAEAASPRRCQNSWVECGYRTAKGGISLQQIYKQYVHWDEMSPEDAARMMACVYFQLFEIFFNMLHLNYLLIFASHNLVSFHCPVHTSLSKKS